MESPSERLLRLRKLKSLPAVSNSVMPITCAAMGAVPAGRADEHPVQAFTVAWPEARRTQSTAGAGRAAYQIETALAAVGHVPPVSPLQPAPQDGPGPCGKDVRPWSSRSEDVSIDRPTDEEKKRALDYVQQSRSGSTMLPMSGTLSFSTRRHGLTKADSTAKYLVVPSGEPGGGNGSDGGMTHGGVFQNVHLLRLFIEQGWKLPRPDVIITINGGGQGFNMKAEEKDKVMRGMMEGTRHLKPWFVCDGVHGCEANCSLPLQLT